MPRSYVHPKFAFRRPSELSSATCAKHAVVIVGAGPVGLTAALDCAQQGLPVLVLDDDDTVAIGSRGLAYSKRTLEIFDRLGVGDQVVGKGVTWNVGRTFFGEREVFNFHLQPEPDHKRPGMVNLQQYYLEQFLVEACERQGVDLRWKSRVVDVRAQQDGVTLVVQTPDGSYSLQADWLIACDGARSPIRSMLGLDLDGRVFKDRFLIADVVMKAQFPPERWFWFDPPFHRHQSVLLHREADDVWRIDFQLGWDADPEEEKRPERVIPRIRAMLGEQVAFDLEWVSIYTFQCRRMARFNHDRVLFAGDSAHQLSPFGGRGANSGIQDADNLVWKLKLVVEGKAPPALLDSYTHERGSATDENLLNSTRSTDFITPKSAASKRFRDAVLQLAQRHPFARKLVNSGRLSVPAFYPRSPLNTLAGLAFSGMMEPGAPMDDAPVAGPSGESWLVDQIGHGFHVLVYVDDPSNVDREMLQALRDGAIVPVEPLIISRRPAACEGARVISDLKGLVAKRYDASDGSTFLIRPDRYIAARWPALNPSAVHAAVATAIGHR